MEKPLVSIIIPVKEYDNDLERCVFSVFKQDYKNFELIIVTPDDINNFTELYGKYNFTLLNFDGGKSNSRNYGAKYSNGKYLFHVDEDMILSDGLLSECVTKCLQNNYRALSVPEYEESEKGFASRIRNLEKIIASSDKYIEAPRFISKDLYEEIGGINPILDPIDEGDLKAKLEESNVGYFSISRGILIIPDKLGLNISKRMKRMFSRGKKKRLFNFLHPNSKQLKPFFRISYYISSFKLLVKEPIIGLCLLFVKLLDLASLELGSFFAGKDDLLYISNESNKRIFNEEARSYQSDFYENTSGAKTINIREGAIVNSLLSDVDPKAVKSILDLGAGGGRWSKFLLGYFPDSKVTAGDLSPEMVLNLKKIFLNNNRFTSIQADMSELPFDNNAFDLLLCIRAIKYAPELEKVLSEIKRVIRPNGTVILEFPNSNFIYWIIKNIPIFGKLSRYANRIKIYSKKEIIEMIKNYGFIVDNAEVRFSIPSTIYKNINSQFILRIIDLIDFCLPLTIFGRSIFFKIRKVEKKSNLLLTKPLVSAIIVNWNGEKWLDKCLGSLMQQTYGNFEILVVDNGSSDNSVNFIKKNYSSVKVIESNENLGFAGGNNVGIIEAKGEYILLINNDTWVAPTFVEKLFISLTSKNVEVVAPKEVNYDGSENGLSDERTIDCLGHPYFAKGKVKDSFYLQGVCLLFSRDFYYQTNGLDNNFFMYFEETDWFWRLNLLNKKFAVDIDLVVNHAGSGTAGKGLQYRTFLWRNQNCLQMLIKNYSTLNLIWILPLYLLQNIFEIFYFVIIGRLNIAWTYILGWWFNIIHIKRTLNKRKWVQTNRVLDDGDIMNNMYFGFAKLQHLLHFFEK